MNVIFHASGSTGLGVFEAARQTRQARDRRRRRPVRRSAGVHPDVDGEGRRRRGVRRDPARRRTARSRAASTQFGLAEGGVGYVYDDEQPARSFPTRCARASRRSRRRSSPAGSTCPARDEPDPPAVAASQAVIKTFRAGRRECAGRDLEVRARRDPRARRRERRRQVDAHAHARAACTRPTRAAMEVDGRDVTGWTTREAIDAGVGMVHQHFMLVPDAHRRRERGARPRAAARPVGSIAPPPSRR